MEYLMTYGWAILVIAIVLGVLYYLGVFNSANLAPRAQPGSCQVFRPNGPGTTYDAELSGTCNNELPEYVAQFNSGSNSQISVPQGQISAGTENAFTQNGLTIAFWIDPTNLQAGHISTVNKWYSGEFAIILINGVPTFYQGAGYAVQLGSLTNNQWQMLVMTRNALNYNQINGYINGQYVGNGDFQDNNPPVQTSNPLTFGLSDPYFPVGLSGSMANIQIYNTSLSTNEIKMLYNEGIGGAPIDINNLVGWWPLNGNAQDYSGNLNNGVPSSIAYSSSWTSGYTAP
jgi:hypothetical protein